MRLVKKWIKYHNLLAARKAEEKRSFAQERGTDTKFARAQYVAYTRQTMGDEQR